MKKLCRTIGRFAMVGVIFLITSCGGTSDLKNDSSDKHKEKKVKEIELNIEEHIQKAINAANLLGGESFVIDEAGNMFYNAPYYRDDLAYAYSYYGKNIKQVREMCENTLAMTEDGEVYNGTTLVSGEYKIKDVLWCTNNMEIDALFITEDGKVLGYSPGSKEYMIAGDEIKIAAGCRYFHDLITVEKNGKGHIRSNADYDRWGNCKIDGWKDVVVCACTANENEKTASVAAISADGTVYATGDYADEILSWGELSYISMDENLIVGLKKDGTLKFAGSDAEYFSSLAFGEVKGVRLWRERFWALTGDGYVTCGIGSSNYHDGEIQTVSSQKAGDGNYMMDMNGVLYENSDGAWLKESDYPSASSGESMNLVYFKQLSDEQLDWGTDQYSSNMCDTSKLSYQLCDIDQDGANEILLSNGGACHAEGYEGVGTLYNGNIEMRIISDGILGYYPESGIVVSGYMGGGVESSTYWRYEAGNVTRIATTATNYNEDWENPKTTYYVGEDIEYERKNKTDSDMGKNEISEDEFNDLLNNYIGNEEMQTIDDEKYLPNTRENRINTFLDSDYISAGKNIQKKESHEQNDSDESALVSEDSKDLRDTDSDLPVKEFTMDCIDDIYASSELSEHDMTHYAKYVIDGDKKTAWVEGVSGQGKGEILTIHLDDTYEIHGFKIRGGYQKSKDLYQKNSRPSDLCIYFDTDDSENVHLSDEYGEQTVTLSSPVSASIIGIEIEDVYPENKYDDTVISEISIF